MPKLLILKHVFYFSKVELVIIFYYTIIIFLNVKQLR
jgi:hypothetical protein